MKKLLTILFFIPLFCFSQIDYDNLIKFTNLSPYTCESYLSSSFGIIKKIDNSKNNTIDKNFCGNCDSIDNLIKIQLLNDSFEIYYLCQKEKRDNHLLHYILLTVLVNCPDKRRTKVFLSFPLLSLILPECPPYRLCNHILNVCNRSPLLFLFVRMY